MPAAGFQPAWSPPGALNAIPPYTVLWLQIKRRSGVGNDSHGVLKGRPRSFGKAKLAMLYSY